MYLCDPVLGKPHFLAILKPIRLDRVTRVINNVLFSFFSFFLPSRADVILQQIMQRCLPTLPPDFQTLYHSKREDNASSNASRHFRNTLREILGQFAISLDVSFICLSACEKNNCERKFKTIAAAYYVLFGRGTNRIENFMSCSCSL